MKLHLILAGLVSIVFATAASAAGISIKPGLWEKTTTMNMPMMTEPQIRTSTECIRDDELGPDDFNMDKDSPCSASEFKVSGNTAKWSIHCPFEGGGTMSGQWQMTSKGNSMNGTGSMSADMNGMKMEMTMSWEGHRLGDCETE